MDYWWEEPDALGYALSPLSDAEIREKFVDRIGGLRNKYETEKEKKTTNKDIKI